MTIQDAASYLIAFLRYLGILVLDGDWLNDFVTHWPADFDGQSLHDALVLVGRFVVTCLKTIPNVF